MSLELIKKIREITGAGISDVKKALDEAGGAEDKAIEILRKSGAKAAAKKAERATKEGVIAFAEDGGKLAVVALACETDFVARTEDFMLAVKTMAENLLAEGKDGFADKTNKFIQDELIVKIGENLQLASFDIFSGPIIGKYLHSNNKIAAVAVLKSGSQEVANDIALHAAAMAPRYLRAEDVPADEVAKEKEIYTEQLKNEGKPAEMLEKILPGKLQKFYSEVCLLNQPYVKDDKMTIEQYLKNNNAEIETFGYYSL